MDPVWIAQEVFSYEIIQDTKTKEVLLSASSLDKPLGILKPNIAQLGNVLIANHNF